MRCQGRRAPNVATGSETHGGDFAIGDVATGAGGQETSIDRQWGSRKSERRCSARRQHDHDSPILDTDSAREDLIVAERARVDAKSHRGGARPRRCRAAR
jgi:hypothetical protein